MFGAMKPPKFLSEDGKYGTVGSPLRSSEIMGNEARLQAAEAVSLGNQGLERWEGGTAGSLKMGTFFRGACLGASKH